LADDAQIVRDEQVRERTPCAKLDEQIHDLRLNRDVELAPRNALPSAGGAGGGAAGGTGGVCEPGADQSGNDSPGISSLHGHCEADGRCTCAPGFDKNPDTGMCL